jgi:hypothetical protein
MISMAQDTFPGFHLRAKCRRKAAVALRNAPAGAAAHTLPFRFLGSWGLSTVYKSIIPQIKKKKSAGLPRLGTVVLRFFYIRFFDSIGRCEQKKREE